ncbi:MAG: hypothetical protein IPQ18_09065 [Saprospiraceae bacterium]|nr:hypothetical protein [Saprospiraceae bacterium]
MKSNNFFVLLTLTLISLGIAVSCKSDKNPKRNPDKALSQLQWLIGSWEGSTKYGTARESWQKMNDSVLIGEGLWSTLTEALLVKNCPLNCKKELFSTFLL